MTSRDRRAPMRAVKPLDVKYLAAIGAQSGKAMHQASLVMSIRWLAPNHRVP